MLEKRQRTHPLQDQSLARATSIRKNGKKQVGHRGPEISGGAGLKRGKLLKGGQGVGGEGQNQSCGVGTTGKDATRGRRQDGKKSDKKQRKRNL